MDLPAGAAGYSQAGLWFGASQDEYVKLVIITRSTGTHVQMLRESAGNVRALSDRVTLGAAAFPVSLRLRIDPVTRTVTGAYAIPGGAARQIASMPVSEALLYRGSFKGEQVATGGIFATYRLAPDPLRYAFEDFRAACVMSTCPSGPAAPDPDFGDGKPSVGVPDDEPPEDSTGPPPSSGSGPPAPARPGDPAPPGTARLDVRRRVRLATLRRTGLHASLTCPAGCGDRVRLSLPRAAARRLHLLRGTASRTTIARGRGAVLDAAQPARLAVRLSRRARRALAAGSMARLRLVLEVHVTPPTGAAVTLRRSVIATR